MSGDTSSGEAGSHASPTSAGGGRGGSPDVILELHLPATLTVPGSKLRVRAADASYEGIFAQGDKTWGCSFVMFCLRATVSERGEVDYHAPGPYHTLWTKRYGGDYRDKPPELMEVPMNSALRVWGELWKALRCVAREDGTVSKGPWRIKWTNAPVLAFFRGNERLERGEERLVALREIERKLGIKESDFLSKLLPEFAEAVPPGPAPSNAPNVSRTPADPREPAANSATVGSPPTNDPPRDAASDGTRPVPSSALTRSHVVVGIAIGLALVVGTALGYLIGTIREPVPESAPVAQIDAPASLGGGQRGNANLTRWDPLDLRQYERTFGNVASDFRGYNAGFRLEDSPEHDRLQLVRYATGVRHRYLFTDCRYYCRAREYWRKLRDSSSEAGNNLTTENPEVKLLPRDGPPAHYFLGTGSGRTPIMYSYPLVSDGDPQFVLEIYDPAVAADLAHHFKADWESPAATRVDWMTQGICVGAPMRPSRFCGPVRDGGSSPSDAVNRCTPSASCSEWLQAEGTTK